MATFAPPAYSFNFPAYGQQMYGLDFQDPSSEQPADLEASFQSFLDGGLDLPLSNDFYNAPLQQSTSMLGPLCMDTPTPNVPARPALSASSGSAASATSSMVGSPTMSGEYVLQNAMQTISMPLDQTMASAFDGSLGGNSGALAFSSSFATPFLPPNPLYDSMYLRNSPMAPVGNPLPHYIPRQHTHPTSPALSVGSNHGPSRTGPQHTKGSRANSPYQHGRGWTPYSNGDIRRPSTQSFAHSSPGSGNQDADEGEREKNRCPFPDCGKIFKDLKAHLLTHQNERPEKCPITSCEYNKKGFSRKYDKNRHTLTHYKGTMVCGFCPGSGSAAEKSFNRADVFKRHLMSVHGVEQNPPNSRKKAAAPTGKATNAASDATGKCSICQGIFSTPQQFYEHLEDCVLSVVQNIEPSEAINEQLLASMADDDGVKETMERHHLPASFDGTYPGNLANGVDDDDDQDSDSDHKAEDGLLQLTHSQGVGEMQHAGSGNSNALGEKKRRGGLTWSKGGVALHRQGRKRRKNYPISWGASVDKMKTKKRVLTVWDGQRRLAKDDMILGTDYEVRLTLPDSDAYVTDLDVQSMKRAEAFHQATEEEKGPPMFTNFPAASFPMEDLDNFLNGA